MPPFYFLLAVFINTSQCQKITRRFMLTSLRAVAASVFIVSACASSSATASSSSVAFELAAARAAACAAELDPSCSPACEEASASA